ncbi:Serine/threonine-protein phosphatase 2A activator 1 [Microbotryomycetes sp. JL201]|nr:Serine/threonine-protein phosphatase 2A activator 1 [Microbotryomycetes sp. JL201]
MQAEVLPELPLDNVHEADDGVVQPRRKIYDEHDVARWTRSEPFHLIETMIIRLSVAVDNKTVLDSCHESQATQTIVNFLQEARDWINDVPLQTGPQRFGNKAFRDWVTKFEQHDEHFQRELVPAPLHAAALPELTHHLRASFGSAARLDYGTGHELSFLAYLLILRLTGILTERDEQAMVTRIFVAYLDLVRKLQLKFNLEPAGSKGVWGLDDHQHLVYLWGASQLRAHPSLKPSAILAPNQIRHMDQSYLFLSSILHVNELKSGPFAEHSPLMHNIATTVPSWTKVSTGLFKMYREEVLKKLPVIQHFWFGRILGWREYVPGGHAFDGPALESSGDRLSPDEKDTIEEIDQIRERDDGTVAPWALPNLTSQGIMTGAPPTRTRHSPLASPSVTPSYTVSGPQSRQGTSQPSLTEPRPFTEPVLFPKRRSSSSLAPPSPSSTSSLNSTSSNTVASQGGAAAGSSPFGVLNTAKLASSNDQKDQA